MASDLLSDSPVPHAVGRCKHAQHGFTLPELLVVMVVNGLLAGIVAPRYFAQLGKSDTQAGGEAEAGDVVSW